MITRRDFGVRGAGEKAVKIDEWLTRGQLKPGTNITFDYLSNYDIRINALTGGTSTESGNRLITVDIDVSIQPAIGQGTEHISIKNDGNKFGTAKYVDVKHNWDLSNPDKFQYSIVDKTQYGLGMPSIHWTNPHSCPKVIGVDSDTVRIWVTDTYYLDPEALGDYDVLRAKKDNNDSYRAGKWDISTPTLPNNDKVSNPETNSEKVGYPKYTITLEEVV